MQPHCWLQAGIFIGKFSVVNNYVGFLRVVSLNLGQLPTSEITAMLMDQCHCEGAAGKGDLLVFYTEESPD